MSKKIEGSVAPRERINISYVPKTDGQTAEVELPLNMLVVGDTGNTQETSHWMNVRQFPLTSTISVQ
ncbi:type VI secretion protein [Escherichia coli]|uniref:Type VI secretion protein n=1 Tax=Escherichia coli TaxID=562 RepID=A0A2X3M4F4_ECOLX|nr:type VI secretion protein [Escherichia coli]